MWHTAADLANARWERDNGIDAVHRGEDSSIDASDWAHEEDKKYVPRQPAPLPTVLTQVKTKAVPAAAAEVESLFAVNLDWQPMPTVHAPVDTKVVLAAAAKIELLPNPPVDVNETQQTPYERIQRRRKQRNAKAVQREEEERFFDAAIGVAEDERTEMAKSEDNPCPFKQAVNEKDSLQPRRKPSIMRSAKDIKYSISRKFCQARNFIQNGFNSHTVHFRKDVMLATYNDRKVSGAIKLLHLPPSILRKRQELKSLIHLCGRTPDAPTQPKIVDQYGLLAPMPSALRQEPTLIPLPSKEMRRLRKQQEKYNGLSER